MKYKNLIFLMLLCSITHQSSAISRNQVKKGLIVAGCVVSGLYIGKKIIDCSNDETKIKCAAACLAGIATCTGKFAGKIAEAAARGFGKGVGKCLGKIIGSKIANKILPEQKTELITTENESTK